MLAVQKPIVAELLAGSLKPSSIARSTYSPRPNRTMDFNLRVPNDPIKAEYYYLEGNEREISRFTDVSQNRGGLYAGVGTIQNYSMMIGHAGAIFIDIDVAVAIFHSLMRVYFLDGQYDHVDDFCTMILGKESAQLLTEYEQQHIAITGNIFPNNERETVSLEFDNLKKRIAHERHDPLSFLHSQERYQQVLDMFRENRVAIITADLFQTRTVARLQRQADHLGVPLTTIYQSNAMEYTGNSPELGRYFSKLNSAETLILMTTEFKETIDENRESYLWDYWAIGGDHMASTVAYYESNGLGPKDISFYDEEELEDVVYLGREGVPLP